MATPNRDPRHEDVTIREYRQTDEQGWVRCRALAFLGTSYFDDVYREKEAYENPSIELIAEEESHVVGLLDVELDTKERRVCSDGRRPAGMVWHLAVHPDFQRRGVGSALLREALDRAQDREIERFEAWTRDDEATVAWYERMGFRQVDSYLHVYLNREEAADVVELSDSLSTAGSLSVQSAFAQYVGDDEEAMCERFDRVHECQRFDRLL